MTSRDPRIRQANTGPFGEIGTTGLKQYGGFVLEEWLNQLSGRKAAWAYREMADNSSVVGSILFAIEMLARKVEWRVECEHDQPIPRANMTGSEFVESCMNDMSHTWGDFLSEALSMLPYGWSFHETVYKRRQGEQPDRASNAGETEEDTSPASSKYNDGLIGWRKLPIRAQETLLRWHFAGYAGVSAMEQVDWHGGTHIIPVEKALLFRTKAARGNPEGRSILRNAFEAWYYLKNIQTAEAIGISRDLAGIPVAKPPEGIDLFAPQHTDTLERVQELVTSVEKDEQQGIVLPQADWVLELLKSGGARQVNTDEVIRRYRQEIASSVLADFILVGLDGIGSYAMVDVKAELFGLVVDAVLDMICEVINKYAIPRLFRLNALQVEELPRITHSSAGRLDMVKVGELFRDLSLAGAPIPWSEQLIEQIFGEMGLPANFEGETTEEVHKAEGEPAPDGQRVIPVTPKLKQRADLLSTQLEREIQSALGHLGEDAATAYMTVAQKASVPEIAALVKQVLAKLDITKWVQARLMPLLRNHAGRVAADTQRLLQAEIGQETKIGPNVVAQMTQNAGRHLRVVDTEPQVRNAIERAIQEGMAVGDNPTKTARRIREHVPAGRFVNAGSKYRAELIARNETAGLQREAILGGYKSNPHVTAIRVRDGIYGPPRSDETCMARDGDTVPIDEASGVLPDHPLCSLSYDPVVSLAMPLQVEPPALLAA
jgi:hypothetical protein